MSYITADGRVWDGIVPTETDVKVVIGFHGLSLRAKDFLGSLTFSELAKVTAMSKDSVLCGVEEILKNRGLIEKKNFEKPIDVNSGEGFAEFLQKASVYLQDEWSKNGGCELSAEDKELISDWLKNFFSDRR